MTTDVIDPFEAAFSEFAKTPGQGDSATPQPPKDDLRPEVPEQQTPANPVAPAAPASADAELQRQLAEALHRERSTANRMSSRDRENQELRRQLEALQQQLNELKARPAPAPAARTEPDVLDGADDLRAAVERRIAEHLAPIEGKLTEAQKRANDAEAAALAAAKRVDPLLEDRQAKAEAEVVTLLDDQFDGWVPAIRSNEFRLWLGRKPAAIQSLFNEGRQFDDCASVLRLYSAETGHAFKKRETAQPTQPEPVASLRSAAGIRPGALPTINARPNPQDFDGAFDEFTRNRKQA